MKNKTPISLPIFAGLLLLLLLLGSCMQYQYAFVSPGRVKPSALKTHNETFTEVARKLSGDLHGT